MVALKRGNKSLARYTKSAAADERCGAFAFASTRNTAFSRDIRGKTPPICCRPTRGRREIIDEKSRGNMRIDIDDPSLFSQAVCSHSAGNSALGKTLCGASPSVASTRDSASSRHEAKSAPLSKRQSGRCAALKHFLRTEIATVHKTSRRKSRNENFEVKRADVRVILLRFSRGARRRSRRESAARAGRTSRTRRYRSSRRGRSAFRTLPD